MVKFIGEVRKLAEARGVEWKVGDNLSEGVVGVPAACGAKLALRIALEPNGTEMSMSPRAEGDSRRTHRL